MDLSIARWIEGMRHENVENAQNGQKPMEIRPDNDDILTDRSENEVTLCFPMLKIAFVLIKSVHY